MQIVAFAIMFRFFIKKKEKRKREKRKKKEKKEETKTRRSWCVKYSPGNLFN